MITGQELPGPNFCSKPKLFLCPEGLPVISHSSKENFISCRQKYYFSKVCGIRSIDSKKAIPLKLGSIWDELVQTEFSGGMTKEKFWELVNYYEVDEYSWPKIYALVKAYKTLGIEVDKTGEPQKEFTINRSSAVITGFIDVAYQDHFDEYKLSARPDFYHNTHNMASQVSTYFMSNNDYEYVTIKSTRLPGQKHKDEDPEAFVDRIYSDIVARPGYYFIGFDRKRKDFGRRYYRSEFQLEDIYNDYEEVIRDILRCENGESNYYQNKKSCYNPGTCSYLPICSNRSVSNELFFIEDKDEAVLYSEKIKKTK